MSNRYVTSALLALIVLAPNLQAVPRFLKRSRPSAPRTQSRTQGARKSVSSFFAPPKAPTAAQRYQQSSTTGQTNAPVAIPVMAKQTTPEREGFFRRHIGARVGEKYQQRSQAKQIKKEARTDFKAAQGPVSGAAQAIRQAQVPQSTPSRWQKLRAGATDLSQRARKQFGRSMTAFEKRIPGTMAYRGSKENRKVQNIKGADIQRTRDRILTPMEPIPPIIEVGVRMKPPQSQRAQAQSAQVVSSAVRMQQASYPAEQATVQVAQPTTALDPKVYFKQAPKGAAVDYAGSTDDPRKDGMIKRFGTGSGGDDRFKIYFVPRKREEPKPVLPPAKQPTPLYNPSDFIFPKARASKVKKRVRFAEDPSTPSGVKTEVRTFQVTEPMQKYRTRSHTRRKSDRTEYTDALGK